MPTATLKTINLRILFVLLALCVPVFLFSQTTQTFTYTGSSQTWVVPPCVYDVQVTVAGAEGGGGSGGNGAVVTATLSVTPGQTLQMNVGGSGQCPGAGWNGGGAGDPGLYTSCGGGGASDIRVSPYNLSNRLIVAGGGGGQAGGNPTNAAGGVGGCASGVTGTASYGGSGTGGSQTAGGIGGYPYASPGTYGQNGSLGQGGAGGVDNCTSSASGGGGGGGYYGGGGGGPDCISFTSYIGGGGGGGGSSFTPTGGNCSQGTNNGPGYITITFTPGSPATASNGGPYCEGNTIQLNATGAGTFSWTGPNGFTSNQQNPTISNATPAMAGTYTVTADDAGCIATATTDVVVNPGPVVDPVSDQTLCAGTATAAVNFTGNVAGATYNWTNSNTSIGLAASGSGNITSFTTTNAGTALITVTPTAGGCTGSPITFTIQVDAAPTVNAVSDQTLCANTATSAVSFTGSSATATYNWANSNASIGLAASGSGDIASFTATNSGGTTQSGTITVTPSENGCTGAPISFIISVDPIPTVDPVTDQNICAGDNTTAINFTGNVSGATYDWTNTNTNIGLAANGSGNIASFAGANPSGATESGTITVTPSANGCAGASESFVISVNPVPTVDPVSDITICAGTQTGDINFTGIVAGATYNWTNDNTAIGLIANGSGNIASFAGTATSATETGNITVTPSVGTCVGTPTSFIVTVNPVPTVDPITDQNICSGDNTSAVNFTGTVSNASYNWANTNTNIGLAASGNGNIASFTGTSSGAVESGTITVTPSANSCTGSSESFVISVNPIPTVNAVSDITICEGDATGDINFTGNIPTATYNWTNSNTNIGLAASGTGNITSFNGANSGTPTESGTVTVTPSVGTCVGNPESFTINVNQAPTGTLTGTTSVCEGDPSPDLTFTGSNGTAPYTFIYNMNGGPNQAITSTGNTATISIPTSPSTVVICFVGGVSDSYGCSTTLTDQATITINPNPTPSIIGTLQYCSGSNTTLSTAQSYSTYSWSTTETTASIDVTVAQNPITVSVTDANGCSGTSSAVNVTETMGSTYTESVEVCQGDSALIHGIYENTAGTYSQTFAGANGCDSISEITLVVNALPNVYAGSDKQVCDGTPVTLTGNGAQSYTWDNGITNNIAFTQNPGTVTYTVTGTDANGCVNTDQVDVTVYALPNVNAGPDQFECEGTQITLSGSGAQTYSWDNGVTDQQTFTQPPGVVTYTVTGTDANGCVNTDQVSVSIEATPVVDAGAAQSICEGEQVVVSGSGALTYSWTGGVQNGVPFTPTATVTLGCTGYTANGCFATDQVTIVVNPLPTASFVADVTTGCEPLDVTLTNTSTGGGGNCSWIIENNTAMSGCGSVGTTIQQAGCFDVSLTVTSNAGCTDTYTAVDYICVDEMPIAAFSYDPSDPNTLHPDVSFENNTLYATDYSWDFGDNSVTSTDFEPDHTYPSDQAASYTVMLIASTPAGCIDTAYQYIAIEEVLIFYIPNTFTPDGDQFNQHFKPMFTSGFDPYDFNMSIFNRWGELIYETNDPEVGWDGSYGTSGQIELCQDGTYVWRIEMKLRNNDDRFIQEGHVNIIR